MPLQPPFPSFTSQRLLLVALPWNGSRANKDMSGSVTSNTSTNGSAVPRSQAAKLIHRIDLSMREKLGENHNNRCMGQDQDSKGKLSDCTATATVPEHSPTRCDRHSAHLVVRVEKPRSEDT